MNVLIVDDHHLVRQGLTQLLRDHAEFQISGEATTGEEALQKIDALLPDVVLLDLYLPDMDGAELVREVHARHPAIKLVVLTVSDDSDDMLRVLMAGATGYAVKSMDFSTLVTSLEWVVAGQVGLSRPLTTRLVRRLQELPMLEPAHAPDHAAHLPEAMPSRLSPRERDVLARVAHGASNKEIARELDLAENTVRTHITSILTKLGMVNRVQAATYAVQMGLTDSDAWSEHGVHVA
jgi:two-component system nitrate/nitrite response regulator NarL